MSKFIRNNTTTYEQIDDKLLILNPKTAKAFECNEVVTDLWKIIEEEKSLSEIIIELAEIYEIGRDELERDITRTLTEMEELELVFKR